MGEQEVKPLPRITATMLRDNDACSSQVETFIDTFPRGATVNVKNASKAVKAGLDIQWAAVNLLTESAYDVYEKLAVAAYDAYNKASGKAWDVYNKAMKEPRQKWADEYTKYSGLIHHTDEQREEYERIRKVDAIYLKLENERCEALKPAQARLRMGLARAFVTAWEFMHNPPAEKEGATDGK